MKKVSVIVPIYNASEYIVRCLSSIVNQTLEEIEIVLVDDHGTDGSMAIAKDFFKDKDANVLFLATETNSGPAAARNIGIAAASGEYVAFVDCDDAIEEDFCRQLYNCAMEHDAEMAFCHVVKKGIDGKDTILRNPIVSPGEFDSTARNKYLTNYQSLFTSYIYRRKMLVENGIAFPPTRSSEDSCFLAESLLCTRRIACIDKPLYIYFRRESSLSHYSNATRYQDKFRSFDALISFAREHSLIDGNREILDFLYIKKAFLVSAFNYLGTSQHPDAETLRKMRTILKNAVPAYRQNSYLTFKIRMVMALIINAPHLACLLLPAISRKMMP